MRWLLSALFGETTYTYWLGCGWVNWQYACLETKFTKYHPLISSPLHWVCSGAQAPFQSETELSRQRLPVRCQSLKTCWLSWLVFCWNSFVLHDCRSGHGLVPSLLCTVSSPIPRARCLILQRGMRMLCERVLVSHCSLQTLNADTHSVMSCVLYGMGPLSVPVLKQDLSSAAKVVQFMKTLPDNNM